MKRTLIATIGLAAVVALGVLWVVLGPARLRGPGKEEDRATIRLKWLHQAQFAGFYVADKKGFYAEEGIKVTLNPGGVDFPAIQMVAGGSEQFGVTGADQILLAREKGVPVVALAVIYRKSPMVFFSMKGSGISVPADFVGRKVGVKYGGNEELTYRAMMRNSGVDMSRVKEVPVKYDMSPFFAGTVDVWPGYVINEAIIAKEQGSDINVIWPTDYGVNFYADALFTTEKMIRDNPDLVTKVVRASLRGWKYATTHTNEAVDYTLAYNEHLNREHETAMMEASIPLLEPDDKPIGSMDPDIWKSMQDLLIKGGFLKGPVVLERAYTSRFLE